MLKPPVKYIILHLHVALAGKEEKIRTPHKQLEVALANDLLEELRRVEKAKTLTRNHVIWCVLVDCRLCS